MSCRSSVSRPRPSQAPLLATQHAFLFLMSFPLHRHRLHCLKLDPQVQVLDSSREVDLQAIQRKRFLLEDLWPNRYQQNQEGDPRVVISCSLDTEDLRDLSWSNDATRFFGFSVAVLSSSCLLSSMLSGSSNILLSLIGWSFIPDFATRQILNLVYKSPIRITTAPTPGSIQHRKHYAITFAFVILTYLTYTLIQAASAMQPNFYQILGVSPNVDENGLKLAFRAFAKRNHPDRPEVGREGEALFMAVRDAFEALKDPVVRFAYDRFGPDVLAWRKTCKTTREFMYQGFMVSSGYHIVTGMALLFWSAIGQPSPVSFWRFVLFASIFAGELSLLLSIFPALHLPGFSSSTLASLASIFFTQSSPTLSAHTLASSSFSILQTMFPHRVPYQHILFLHQVFMFLSVALSRVVPYFVFLFDDSQVTQPQVNPADRALWERTYTTLAIADREASIILHTVLQSISPASSQTLYHDPTLARMQPLSQSAMTEVLELLTPEMQSLVVEANIKNNHAGPIATAWEAALLKAIRLSPIDSDKALEKDGVEKSKKQSPERASSTLSTPQRSKNFWEKEVVEEVTVLPAVSEPPLVEDH